MIKKETGLNTDHLLFEGKGGWCIYAWGSETVNIEDESFITHACPVNTEVIEVYIFHVVGYNMKCLRCNKGVPDEVMALWYLHNGAV